MDAGSHHVKGMHMAVTGVWKIAVIGLGPGGEAIVNTFYYGPDGADVAVDGNLVASTADGTLPAQIQGLVTGDWAYLKTTVLCVHGTNVGKSGENADSAPMVGGLAGASAALSICALGKRKADGIGRHARGRLFLSPIPASTVNVDGKFTPPAGFVAAWAAAAVVTITPAADTFIPGLWDIPHTQFLPILTSSVAPNIGIQKRRRLRLPN